MMSAPRVSLVVLGQNHTGHVRKSKLGKGGGGRFCGVGRTEEMEGGGLPMLGWAGPWTSEALASAKVFESARQTTEQGLTFFGDLSGILRIFVLFVWNEKVAEEVCSTVSEYCSACLSHIGSNR